MNTDDATPVCLISGGSSGVGLATAGTFAAAGYRVAICGRDQRRLDEARDSLLRENPAAMILPVVADVSDIAAVRSLVQAVTAAWQQIDVLVNNAALAPLAPLDEMSDAEIDRTIDLNIRGTYLLTREVWRVMKQQGRGLLVNVSSQAARDPFPGFSLYGSSKAWLELLTVALAREGREFGIRVYGVRPGAVETPMLRGLFADFPAEQTVSPNDVAEVIWHVCQPPMRNSSGQIVDVTRQ